MTPQPAKPKVAAKSVVSSAPKEAAKAEEKVAVEEGAPATVTPESPGPLPSRVPVDEEVIETPEKKPDRAPKTKLTSQGQIVEKVAESRTESLEVPAGPSPVDVTDPEIQFLRDHVSAHPVDAHAPVWTARQPNTTGGYS